MKFKMFFCLLLAVLTFTSCIGMNAEIVMRSNGSGRITLEYRVSQMLESLGRLDGNENWPAIPVGRGDFERAVARIPGLRLVSHSSRDVPGAAGGRDLLTTVVLDFQNPAVLLAVLDNTLAGASFVRENGRNFLRLTLRDASDDTIDADLLSLFREFSEGYTISISLRAPNNASLAVMPPSAPGERSSSGRNASFSIGTGDLFSFEEGLSLEFGW